MPSCGATKEFDRVAEERGALVQCYDAEVHAPRWRHYNATTYPHVLKNANDQTRSTSPRKQIMASSSHMGNEENSVLYIVLYKQVLYMYIYTMGPGTQP